MLDLIKRIIDILEDHAGRRAALGLIVLLLGLFSSNYIASNEFTPKQILADAAWIPFPFWYVAVFYTRIRREFQCFSSNLAENGHLYSKCLQQSINFQKRSPCRLSPPAV